MGNEETQKPQTDVKNVIMGPAGQPITIDDLPAPGTKRWVVRRKAEDACKRYTLSVEEFASWQTLVDRYGVRGLRATRVQEYRGDS